MAMRRDHNLHRSDAYESAFNNGGYGSQNFAEASIGSGNLNGNFGGPMRLHACAGSREQDAYAYYESVHGAVSPYSRSQNKNVSGGMNYSQAYSGNSRYTSNPTLDNRTYDAGDWNPRYTSSVNEVRHVSHHHHHYYHPLGGPVYNYNANIFVEDPYDELYYE